MRTSRPDCTLNHREELTMEDRAKSAENDISAQFLQNRKKRRQRRLVGFLAVVAIVGGYFYWSSQNGEVVSEDETLIVEVAYGNIENAIPAAGSLQPREIVPIGARASGELVEILVEVGDRVEEGQIVAQIDPEEQRLRVRSSTLSLQNQLNQIPERELTLELALLNLARTERLAAENAATEQELENARKTALNAEISLENAKNSIEQSRTSLEQEEVQLRYTEVKAPMDGTIISLDQKEGATLNASQTAPTVMQIADLRSMMVEVEISEADISALEEGVDVYFTTLGSGERRWYGNLRQILPMPTTSNNVVLFTGRFDVDNSDGDLYPGMTTEVFFVTSSAENVLTVPLGALTFTNTPAAGRGSTGEGGTSRQNMAGRAGGMPGGGQPSPEMMARMEEMRASGNFDGGFQGGGFPGGGFPGGGRGGNNNTDDGSILAGQIALSEPRQATVQLVQADGSFVTREVMIGVTDRVNAEVISGLEAGDRVVAGILQARLEDDDDDNNWSNNNSWRGGGGGFRPF